MKSEESTWRIQVESVETISASIDIPAAKALATEPGMYTRIAFRGSSRDGESTRIRMDVRIEVAPDQGGDIAALEGVIARVECRFNFLVQGERVALPEDGKRIVAAAILEPLAEYAFTFTGGVMHNVARGLINHPVVTPLINGNRLLRGHKKHDDDNYEARNMDSSDA